MSKAIEAAKPRDEDYELGDAGSGLRLKVTAKGARIFRWYAREGGERITATIGRWSAKPRPGYVTLAEARHRLEKLKEAKRAGRLKDALKELSPKPLPKLEPGAGGALTVRQLAADFLVYIERRRKRPEQARRPLEMDVLPSIGDRSVESITPNDCVRIVEAVVSPLPGAKRKVGAPTQAGAVFAVLKQLFRFAQGRGRLALNPCAPLDPEALGIVKNTCQRFLSAEEIGQFWRALDSYTGMTPTVRAGLKLLLLTGVRSGELLRATWAEVDCDAATWTVPKEHQKLTKRQEQTARPWAVPLSPMALDLFRDLQTFAKSLRSPYVMASLHTPGEALTEKALNHAMRRMFTGDEPLLSFAGERPTPHDLRRTMRSHMGSELRVPFHVAERCLNHSLGKVADIYDRGDYLAERRAALEKWAAYVERLVAPESSNVAFLPGKGA
jgi:integrase